MGTAFEADAGRLFSGAESDARISTRSVKNLRVRLDSKSEPVDADEPITITVPGRAGNNVLDLLKADIEPHATMQINVQGPVPDRVRLAVLSWAFLAAFAQYGYAFALEPAVRIVRRTLLDQSAEPLPSMAFSRPGTGEIDSGTMSLVIALGDAARQVRLVGLAIDFGRTVGVLPIASDREARGYRDLEHLLLFDTAWKVVIEPIEEIVKVGALGSFERGLAVTSDPYVVVGVERTDAERELAEGSLVPAPQRARSIRGIEVPHDPPAELPHRLTVQEWEAMSRRGVHGQRHLRDLKQVAVEGHHIYQAEDANDEDVVTAMNQVRARFQPGGRPQIRYRGQLMEREERELLWLWGLMVWPDGQRLDIGPFLSRAALIEGIQSAAQTSGLDRNPPWSREST